MASIPDIKIILDPEVTDLLRNLLTELRLARLGPSIEHNQKCTHDTCFQDVTCSLGYYDKSTCPKYKNIENALSNVKDQ